MKTHGCLNASAAGWGKERMWSVCACVCVCVCVCVSLIFSSLTSNSFICSWFMLSKCLPETRKKGRAIAYALFNLLQTKCNLLYIRNWSVPRCKHFPPRLYKKSQLILYREIMAVCSEIHAKLINTLCGHSKILNWWYTQWPLCGTYSNHWGLES